MTNPNVRIVRFSEIQYIRMSQTLLEERRSSAGAHSHHREIYIGLHGGKACRRFLAPWMPEAFKKAEGGKATPRNVAAATRTVEGEAQATEGPGGEDAESDDNEEVSRFVEFLNGASMTLSLKTVCWTNVGQRQDPRALELAQIRLKKCTYSLRPRGAAPKGNR